jgi:hypothetical protein
MPRKRYSVEQIMSKLREAEVELSRGATTPEACRKIGVSTQTFFAAFLFAASQAANSNQGIGIDVRNHGGLTEHSAILSRGGTIS